METVNSIVRDPRIELAHKALEEASTLLMKHFPMVKKICSDAVETIFVPKAIAKQLALLVVLDLGMMTLDQLSIFVKALLSNFSSRSRLIMKLQREQRSAATQDEWMDLAERIDSIQQNDVWRSDPDCPLYERERISARMNEYVHLMRRQDLFELMFLLRGSIGRNRFGLLHEGLFSKALAGTKVLVETYHNVVCAALDYVCDAPVSAGEEPIPTDARLAFFNETRHSYGRTALLLSGGAALGFYHAGVVKTMIENRLMPRVLGGSSAGSIVCAMIGTRTDEECMHDLFNVKGTEAPGHSGRLALNFFRPWQAKEGNQPITTTRKRGGALGGFGEVVSNTAGAFRDFRLTLQGFVPMTLRHFSSMFYDIVTGNRRAKDIFMKDTDHFRKCVKANVGDFTFQEAFDRTGRILNITVTPSNRSDPPRLLNYLTAPHVLVWSAAVASSSLPGVFESNRLVVKEADGWERYESSQGQRFWDGSMESDLPMQQLSEMFNINHFIISQANPHAVMFATYNQKQSVWTDPITGLVRSVLAFLKGQVRSWVANFFEVVGARRIAPLFETQRGLATQFFTQEYEGRACDISLIPWISHRGLFSALLHIIYNPSETEFREWITAAERETWRHLPAIKSHIAEEVTLDRCVQRLRRRLVHESWGKQSKTSHSKTPSRVPSFFTSTSLVNLGGLGVADQPTVQGIHPMKSGMTSQSGAPSSPPRKVPSITVVPEVDVNSGWGGLGLRGNRSSGNLNPSSSVASGLFIDDEETAAVSTEQNPGENTSMESKKTSSTSLQPPDRASSTGEPNDTNGYFKTTSMANFYYRNASKHRSLDTFDRIHQEEEVTFPEANAGSRSPLETPPEERRLSKSVAALSSLAEP